MNQNNTNTDQSNIDIDPEVALFMELEGINNTPSQQSQSAGDGAEEEVPEEEPEKALASAGEGGNENVNDGKDVVDNNVVDSTKAFNVNEFLEQSSEGMFKSEDDLKSAISKLKEYDSLQVQIDSLKAEKESIFANKEIETLNRLHKEGKTNEQIQEFMKLSKIDLSSIDPKEVLIQGEIMKGHTREFAEIIVERKYGIDKLSFDEEVLSSIELENNKKELEIAKEMMKIDSDPIRKSLQKDLADLSSEVSPTEKALKDAANKAAYKQKLEPFIDNTLIAGFPKSLVVGDESTGIVSYDVPKELLDSIRDNAFEYFLDQEVNEDSVNDFMVSQKALWLYNNQKDILEKIKNQVEVATEKRIRAEYENNQGLPKQNSIPVVKQSSLNDQLMAIAEED